MQFSKFPVTQNCLGIVADWTHALNSKADLSKVLDRLMRLAKADAAMIIRTSVADGKARYVARSDVHIGKVWPTRPQSYMHEIVGDYVSGAKTGSIWKLSEMISSGADTLANAGTDISADVSEAIVTPLEMRPGYIDHIEFHFKHRPAEHDTNLIVMLMATLVDGWKRRTPASVSKMLNQQRRLTVPSSSETRQFSILDSENPAQLSRSEYRVCYLLSEGMTVDGIAAALSIAKTTVRSHLSSIFSKTGTSSQVELIHQINIKPDALTAAEPVGHLRVS